MAGVGVYTVRKQRKVKSTLLGIIKDHLRKEEMYAPFFFNFKIYFIWQGKVLVLAWGILFSDQGLNPGPLLYSILAIREVR